MLRNDGSQFWALLDMSITRNADSTPICRAVLSDITKRRLLELSEHDQHQLAEALRDTAMTLNSTLKLDDILDSILGNIGKLVKYDAAMVLLVEGDAVRNIRYRNNPLNATSLRPLGDLQANLLNVPILNTIIRTRKPQLIPDIQKDIRWQSVAIPDMKQIHSLVCVPIESHGIVIGVINILSTTPDFFTPLHTERITVFASQAAVAMENAQLYEKAKLLSVTDPLTELFNMRYFHDFASLEFERVRRYSRTLSVAMVDIDHFKVINDTHGHGIGDLVLREISARIKNSIRTVDVVARYGGDEFIILMPETALNEARQVAERVWRAVAESAIEKAGDPVSVTLSIGIAEMKKGINSLDELIKCADQSLYKAKSSGTNRIGVYSDKEQYYTTGILGGSPVSG
jgi:diguanylate cyclase (GGDEF)-like protein